MAFAYLDKTVCGIDVITVLAIGDHHPDPDAHC